MNFFLYIRRLLFLFILNIFLNFFTFCFVIKKLFVYLLCS